MHIKPPQNYFKIANGSEKYQSQPSRIRTVAKQILGKYFLTKTWKKLTSARPINPVFGKTKNNDKYMRHESSVKQFTDILGNLGRREIIRSTKKEHKSCTRIVSTLVP